MPLSSTSNESTRYLSIDAPFILSKTASWAPYLIILISIRAFVTSKYVCVNSLLK